MKTMDKKMSGDGKTGIREIAIDSNQHRTESCAVALTYPHAPQTCVLHTPPKATTKIPLASILQS